MTARHDGGDDLFSPTVDDPGPAEPLYSVQANVLTAFFGGPLAATIFSSLNLRRMRRPPLEYVLPVAVGAIYLAAFAWVALARLRGELPDWADENRNVRLAWRLLSLAFIGTHWAIYRRRYRAQRLLGLDPPSPWTSALASIGVGIVVAVAIVVAVTMAGGGFIAH